MYRVLYQFGASHEGQRQPAHLWRQITSMLPEDVVQASTGPRVLWRMEDADTILVQYPVRPHPAWLLPGTHSFPLVMDMRVLMDTLGPRQVWTFSLVASTVRRAGATTREHHGGGEYQVSAQEWLTGSTNDAGETRAFRSGFRVLRMSDDNQRVRRANLAGLTRIRGLLEVEDTESLRAALEEGMGRGKNHGAGMLSLSYPSKAPASPDRPTRRRQQHAR